jgi:hypothetical protein
MDIIVYRIGSLNEMLGKLSSMINKR